MKLKFLVFCQLFLVVVCLSGCDNSGEIQKVEQKDVKEIPSARPTENPPAAPFNDAIKDNPNIPDAAKKTMLRDSNSGSSSGG